MIPVTARESGCYTGLPVVFVFQKLIAERVKQPDVVFIKESNSLEETGKYGRLPVKSGFSQY